MSSNIFTRLFRYPTKKVSPIENQLTECLGVLCEQCEGFKTEFVKLFIPNYPIVDPDRLKVSTQSPYRLSGSTKYIDFEFWAENDNGSRQMTCFIEVKVWSGENYSSGEKDDEKEQAEIEKQTDNYQRILCDPINRLSKQVGIFSLTPFTNPLSIEVHRNKDLNLYPTTNIYWSQVGKLAKRLASEALKESERFLCQHFFDHLKRIGIMSEQRISVNDIAIAESYLSVKTKLWATLEPVAALMKERLPKGGDKPSYGTASRQERDNERFVAYQHLDRSKQIAVFAGYQFFDAQNIWVGAWLEGHPNHGVSYNDLRDTLSSDFKCEIDDPTENVLYDGEWHVWGAGGDEWWIAARGKALLDYVKEENAVKMISDFLCESITTLLDKKIIQDLIK